jgi:hypothetical protein
MAAGAGNPSLGYGFSVRRVLGPKPDRRVADVSRNDPEQDHSVKLAHAHLRVGVIGLIIAVVGVVFTAIAALSAVGVFDHSEPVGDPAQHSVATATTPPSKQPAERQRFPHVSIPAEIQGNRLLAERYREARLLALRRAGEKLRSFVTSRIGLPVPCDLVKSVSAQAVAALRCEIDGVEVSYVRLTSSGAIDDYFGDRLRSSASHTWVGTRDICHNWWSFWQNGGQRIGYLASRRHHGRALLVWSYDRHSVVAMASVPKSDGLKVCDFWFAHA